MHVLSRILLMAITLNFPQVTFNSGNTIDLSITFGSIVVSTVDATRDNGFLILDYGKLEWRNELDNVVMVTGRLDLKIVDSSSGGELRGSLFPVVGIGTDPRGTVTLTLTTAALGARIFRFIIAEETRDMTPDFLCSFSALTSTDLISKESIFVENTKQAIKAGGEAWLPQNPFGYTVGATNMPRQIDDIRNLLLLGNTSGSLAISLYDLQFGGEPPGPIAFGDFFFVPDLLYFNTAAAKNPMGIRTATDVLKRTAFSFGMFTGIFGDQLFFTEAFYKPNGSPTQTFNTILDVESEGEFPIYALIKFDSFEGDGNVNTYLSGDTNLSLEVLTFFKNTMMYFTDSQPSNPAFAFTQLFSTNNIGDPNNEITQVRHPTVASNAFQLDMGQFTTDLWAQKLLDDERMHYTVLKVQGVDVDYVKLVSYQGGTYQILTLIYDITNDISTVKMINVT